MDEYISKIVDDMLYGDFSEDVIEKLDNPEYLHILAKEYNYDDGSEIPELILKNSHCELSTALLIFELCEGYDFLEEKEDTDVSEYDDGRFEFIKKLYEDIIKGKYRKGHIGFQPSLTKVQIYKMKKFLEEQDEIFITEIEGKEI